MKNCWTVSFSPKTDPPRHAGARPACHCELAFVGDEAVGIVTWYLDLQELSRPARRLYLEDLFVRPQFRGRGLGTALLAHLARHGARRTAVLEWQVLDWNAPSIEFYNSLGAACRRNWISYRLEGEALEKLAMSDERHPGPGDRPTMASSARMAPFPGTSATT